MADLSEKVYHLLKADLMAEFFPLNELIIEQTLTERYQVSRTPVREAAMRLVHEGYLVKYPKKGYTVRCIGEEELNNLKVCRYILEEGIIDIVVEDATDDEIKKVMSYVEDREKFHSLVYWSHQFHINLAKLTGNSELVLMLEELLYKLARPAAKAQQQFLERYRLLALDAQYIEPEHVAIISSLLQRDGKKAKEFLKKDIFDILQ